MEWYFEHTWIETEKNTDPWFHHVRQTYSKYLLDIYVIVWHIF